MSVMRERQLEACQDRLYRCPANGIFDELCEDEVRTLYTFSYYAKELRRKTPGQQELKEMVLRNVSLEACYLSPGEDNLVKRILRGGGDTRFLLLADSSCVWFISLPLGALAGFVWHLSPGWIYFLLNVEFPLKGIVCFIRYCSGKWIQEIKSK